MKMQRNIVVIRMNFFLWISPITIKTVKRYFRVCQRSLVGVSMNVFKSVIGIVCFYTCSVYAGTINCEPSSSPFDTIHSDFELKPPGTNITIGSNIADWSVLYTLSHVSLSAQENSCSINPYVAYLYYSNNTTLLNTVSGQKIYATNVPGIGISIATYWGNQPKQNIGPYPDYAKMGEAEATIWFDIDVTFWKIPGEMPMAGGPVSINGPEVGMVYYGNTYTMTSSDPNRIVPFSGNTSGTGYLAFSRILHATLMFQPGTCNLEGDNVNVDMGNYDGAGGHSTWKDASFKLVCPDGNGYGGSYRASSLEPYAIDPNGTYVDNNKQNGRVQISIAPYTETLDANRGIIALDGTGAQGYGIQLAWGDYSTQNLAEPSKPVIVNSYVDAHSLNAAFSADDTPIGGNGLVGLDNTIKMAARYIRTTGKTQPGPANAVVQVIANYQ